MARRGRGDRRGASVRRDAHTATNPWTGEVIKIRVREKNVDAEVFFPDSFDLRQSTRVRLSALMQLVTRVMETIK